MFVVSRTFRIMKDMMWRTCLIFGWALSVCLPSSGKASYSIALSDLKAGQYPAALATIEQVLKEDPKSAAALELKGRILTRMQRPAEAMQALESALASDPERPSIHFHMGRALFLESRWPEATGAFRHSLELDPENRDPILPLIYCLVVMENYPAAHQWVSTLDPTNESDPDYYFARAAMALAIDQPEDAMQVLQQARTIYSTEIYLQYEPDFLHLTQALRGSASASAPPAPAPQSP